MGATHDDTKNESSSDTVNDQRECAVPYRKKVESTQESKPAPVLSNRNATVSNIGSASSKNDAKSGKGVQGRLTPSLGYCKPTSSTTVTKKVEASVRRQSLKRSYSAQCTLDPFAKNWLTNAKKRPKTAATNDRFIPARDQKTIESAQYRFMEKKQTLSLDESDQTYRQIVANACGVQTGRLLSSKQEKAEPEVPDMTKNSADYTLRTTAPATVRRILTAPVKILDAPYLADDYYLNLLDWSKLNVVAVALDRSVYLWNADNGSIRPLNYQGQDAITSVRWSTDGAYLAVGTANGDTQVWDAEANTKLRSMVGQQHRIGVLSWDKHLVSSGAQDGSIWHHDVRISQHKVMELNGHSDEVCGLQWRWDGTMLASGGNDNVVQVWDVRSNKPRLTKRHEGAVKALAWCPWNRHTLATGGGRNDRSIQVWNTSTSLRIHKIDTESQITSLHWSKHYKEIVSSHGYPNNQLTVWEYPSFNRIIDIPGHDSRILHTAMSPDGQMVATAAADENLKFWRIFEHDGRSKYDTKSILNNRPALVRSKSIR